MKHSFIVVVLAGLVPILVVNFAFWINVDAGLPGCIPYWDGCHSVSRGVRSGSGLVLFKVAALPTAALMACSWVLVVKWLRHDTGAGGTRDLWTGWLGIAGAVFFIVYAIWLGTEGDIYRWMRRYGVVFYFGFTGLAQLMLASRMWKLRTGLANGALNREIGIYLGIVVFMWVLGVASAFKRKLVDDPALLDRVENALEWDFALAMSLAFIALGLVLRKAGTVRSGS